MVDCWFVVYWELGTTKCFDLKNGLRIDVFLILQARQDVEVGQNLEALKDLPRLFKENQDKLSALQMEYQTCLSEKNVLQERIKNHSFELNAKSERIADLETHLSEVKSCCRKWEKEAESLEAKVELLQTQIDKKNSILDKNSAQLEERIRDYSAVAAQLERLRDEHSKEVEALKSNTDTQIENKLRNLEIQNARLEAQLSLLRTEKTNCEKDCKKRLRLMEEQVRQQKVRSTTLEKHLETIQATYKALFPSEGIPWTTLLRDLPSPDTDRAE